MSKVIKIKNTDSVFIFLTGLLGSILALLFLYKEPVLGHPNLLRSFFLLPAILLHYLLHLSPSGFSLYLTTFISHFVIFSFIGTVLALIYAKDNLKKMILILFITFVALVLIVIIFPSASEPTIRRLKIQQ